MNKKEQEKLLEINRKKTIRQKDIVTKWIINKYRGTLIAATGFGKTFTAVIAIMWLQSKRKETRVIIEVPTLYLQEQWRGVLKNNNIDTTFIQVQVINTGCKLKQECDLLIIDEVHSCVSECFAEVFNNTKYKVIFCLTATLERSDGREEIVKQFAPVVDVVSLEECLREGYISNYRLYNIAINMTEEEKKIYKRINDLYIYYEYLLEGKGRAWTMSNVIVNSKKLLSKKDFEELYNNEQYLAAINFKRLIGKRKEFLNNLSEKLTLCDDILKAYPDRKAVTFTEVIKVAEKVQALNPESSVIYHSKLSKKQKKENIERFIQDPTVRILSTVRALDKGMDIPSISLGITLSGTSKSLQATQRLGRTVRVESEDKIALFFNFYLANSQDEKWLKSRCYRMPNVYYINSLNDII